ncbi:hypothetical protein DXX98_08955 [Janibacter melonis]|nr:hypothetical protein [Janibacter melonis]
MITVSSVSEEGLQIAGRGQASRGIEVLAYEVRFTVADQSYRGEVRVARKGGWRGDWRIQNSLAQPLGIKMDTVIDEVDARVGGSITALKPGASEMVLYPGEYTMRVDGGDMMTFPSQQVVVGDEPVDLEVNATRPGKAAKPAVLDAAEDALSACLSGGGRTVRCTGGAIALSADELGSTPDWSLQGKITATRDPKINLRYKVRAHVVAAGTDTSGTAAEQRFIWEGDVYLRDITSDSATASARWYKATRAR